MNMKSIHPFWGCSEFGGNVYWFGRAKGYPLQCNEFCFAALRSVGSAFISQVSWYTRYSAVLPKKKRTQLQQFMYLLLHPSCSLSGGASRSVFWALWCLLCSTWPWQRVPCLKGARRGGEVSQPKEPKQWRSCLRQTSGCLPISSKW